jgi:hypothetical protein
MALAPCRDRVKGACGSLQLAGPSAPQPGRRRSAPGARREDGSGSHQEVSGGWTVASDRGRTCVMSIRPRPQIGHWPTSRPVRRRTRCSAWVTPLGRTRNPNQSRNSAAILPCERPRCLLSRTINATRAAPDACSPRRAHRSSTADAGPARAGHSGRSTRHARRTDAHAAAPLAGLLESGARCAFQSGNRRSADTPRAAGRRCARRLRLAVVDGHVAHAVDPRDVLGDGAAGSARLSRTAPPDACPRGFKRLGQPLNLAPQSIALPFTPRVLVAKSITLISRVLNLAAQALQRSLGLVARLRRVASRHAPVMADSRKKYSQKFGSRRATR